jgi:hypothetical protein
LEYKFFKLFPKNLTSIPVSYGTSDILKVSASFEYERYIAGKTTSKSVKSGTSNNRGSVKTEPIPPEEPSLQDQYIEQQRRLSGVVPPNNNIA